LISRLIGSGPEECLACAGEIVIHIIILLDYLPYLQRALRENKNLASFRIDHNIIGPACGKDVGMLLKNSSIKVLSMSYNRLGEIVRYPTLYSREKIKSAAHDIFLGVCLELIP